MQLNVSTRHTEVTPQDRDLILEKISRIGGKFLEMDRAEIHFFEERNPRIHDKDVCEITLEGHGHHVRAKANGPDHLTATDRAIEKLENNLRKLKTKLSSHRGHRDVARASLRTAPVEEIPVDVLLEEPSSDSSVAAADAATAEADEYAANYQIVKTKKVENMLLTPIDAAMRMDLVGHSFYFFTNVETERPAVVYRREDGDIGLIDEG